MEYTFWKYYCWSGCLPILSYSVSSALPVERSGGGGVLLVKTYWVFIQNFRYEIKQNFIIQSPKLWIFLDIFESGISLKSKIPSYQCEITNEAEHIGPLQKANSLLHISKYLDLFKSPSEIRHELRIIC